MSRDGPLAYVYNNSRRGPAVRRGVQDGTIDQAFSPGRDIEVVVHTRATYVRSPRHETGLREYGRWLQSRGFNPSTSAYPCDFVIPGATSWLGEYKVVYGHDQVLATRHALAQLKEYRYFYYASGNPGLLAVFSEPIDSARMAWLTAEGVLSVWRDADTWSGSPEARAAHLCA
jgi:hypothetical protein